jgi:hypothetical protein
MSLSQAEQTQLKALIVREGGYAAFDAELDALYVATTQTAALVTLTPAITVTVQDWVALNAYVAQASNATLYSVMAAIGVAATAKDATQLGPLLVALYAAVKAHLKV